MVKSQIERLARDCGFELCGVASVQTLPEFAHFRDWAGRGLAGGMGYLTDHRAGLRSDVRNLLPSARSVISLGKLYNTAQPYSIAHTDSSHGWISRYAWGADYHGVLRAGLDLLAAKLHQSLGVAFEYRVCVDTAPLLERALARHAGLGWLGRNTCLINQHSGSWFFLGELLVSLDLEPDAPPPDRCGTCRSCIDACPTAALVERDGRWELDARRCLSYLTIEHRGAVPAGFHAALGRHVFGCDICQDVCPWNRTAPVTDEPAFAPVHFAPPLDELAALSEAQFRSIFQDSPVLRAKYNGFHRNVEIACANRTGKI